jgi:hypothetical protein
MIFKAPNSKYQIPNKLQWPRNKIPNAPVGRMVSVIEHFEFGIYLGFGAWNLGFQSFNSAFRI